MIKSISETEYDSLINSGWASVITDNDFMPDYNREEKSRAKAPYCADAERKWQSCTSRSLTRTFPVLVYPYFDPERDDETIVFPQKSEIMVQPGNVIYKCWGERNGLTVVSFKGDEQGKVWLTTPPVIGVRQLTQRPVFLKTIREAVATELEKNISGYMEQFKTVLYALTVRVFISPISTDLTNKLAVR